MNILSSSPKQTKDVGKKLGKVLGKGDIVALIGELGAGKTCFTKGLLKEIGVNVDNVTSPTFVLINEYRGKLPVYHFDVYRLNNIQEVVELGYEEYFDGDGVTVIEWADKVEEILPDRCIRVYIEIINEKERQINIEGLKEE